VPRSGAQPVGPRPIRRALLSAFCLCASAACALLAWPVVAPRLDIAFTEAGEANAGLLLLAGVLFACAPACCGLLWHAALTRAGSPTDRLDTCARYGVGSLLNSFAPAHIGDIVRAGLLCESLPPGGRRSVVRCFGVVQLYRVGALASFAAISALPARWTPLGLCGVAALALTGRRAGPMLLFSLLALAAKVGAVAVLLASLGTPAPMLAALAVVPALELAAVVPLTPGNLGVASAAAAVALHAHGVTTQEAVPASVILHAVETIAGICFGAGSTVLHMTRSLAPARGRARLESTAPSDPSRRRTRFPRGMETRAAPRTPREGHPRRTPLQARLSLR
jgi:uncharacterized membrane protein YbhN (UPF0104 family)